MSNKMVRSQFRPVWLTGYARRKNRERLKEKPNIPIEKKKYTF